MKNLSDFKNRIQVGVKLKTTYHFLLVGREQDGTPIYGDEIKPIREISIKQSNSFALKTVRQDGKKVDSWCNFPKSSEIEFLNNNTVRILEKQTNGEIKPVLTYEFI